MTTTQPWQHTGMSFWVDNSSELCGSPTSVSQLSMTRRRDFCASGATGRGVYAADVTRNLTITISTSRPYVGRCSHCYRLSVAVMIHIGLTAVYFTNPFCRFQRHVLEFIVGRRILVVTGSAIDSKPTSHLNATRNEILGIEVRSFSIHCV
jgi:hypothetical protein